MSEIQQSRYDRLLRRVGDLKGQGSKVKDALTELFPVIDVENLNAELALLSTWRLAFSATVQFQSAGDINLSQIFNPAGSSQLVVLERVDLFSATAQRIEFLVGDTALANPDGNAALRDTREGVLVGPVGQLRSVQQVLSIAQFGLATIEAGVTFTIEDKRGLFVLAPGTGVTFGTTIVNTSFNVSYLWRERVAEPSELNF